MKVAVIMGSSTDLKVMKEAVRALKEFEIPSVVKIVSAHRTPLAMVKFSEEAIKNGYSVIIAGAGAAAHLPGMVASLTFLPVIGVPVTVNKLAGIDALLSIAQMPRGIPVATVAIDNAYNAGLLAARILAISHPKIASRLERFQKKQIRKVKEMNKELKART
ncbi:MAG: 5-(carboxyamino)imidazole ribonucleotide mutase [Bdellovibrionaceae bacterium]|jgi:5-(carboxyamino)imidazole ribonucleotide mutase|nr:5-(carboxyamino)imidazole ribonucleotide mutase [Pseudobdellovibrionaceae bacterium]